MSVRRSAPDTYTSRTCGKPHVSRPNLDLRLLPRRPGPWKLYRLSSCNRYPIRSTHDWSRWPSARARCSDAARSAERILDRDSLELSLPRLVLAPLAALLVLEIVPA